MIPWLSMLGLAEAHRPHAVVRAFAATEDFQVSGRAWMVHDPNASPQLLTSNDFGAHWDHATSPAEEDDLVDLAYVGRRLFVLAEDGTLWRTDDEGASWDSVDLPVGIAAALDSDGYEVAVATDLGIWIGTGDSLKSMRPLLEDQAILDVTFGRSADVLLAIDQDGTGWISTDRASFEALPEIGGSTQLEALAETGGEVWAGTSAQLWRKRAVGWAQCEHLGEDWASFEDLHVSELYAAADGELYVALGKSAYFRSQDGCETWTEVSTGLDASWGGIGGVQTADEAYVGFVAEGRSQIVAGFDGVVTSDDGGETWRSRTFMPADRVRGLFLAPDFPADPRIVIGLYGGGVGWTEDGGRTWHGGDEGLEGVYNYDIAPSASFGDDDTVFWAGGSPDPPAVSRDGGATWETIDNGLGIAVSVCTEPDAVYVFGSAEEDFSTPDGRMLRSRDGGQTWEEFPALEEAVGDGYPGAAHTVGVDGERRLFVGTDVPAGLYASADDGASWTELHVGESVDVLAGFEVWDGHRVLYASVLEGLLASEDGGVTWTELDAPVDHPRAFAQADDGTLFLAGGDGQLWGSEDGGEAWRALGDPLAPAVAVIRPAPAYATNGIVLVGTSEGVFWTDDRGGAWHMLPRFQRFSVSGYALACTGICTPEDTMGGEVARRWVLAPGDVVSFSFEGDAFGFVGMADSATIEARVDGEVYGLEHLAVRDLPPGWHEVELHVVAGVASIDAVEVFGPGEPLPIPLAASTDDTGDSAVDSVGETAADSAGDTAPPDADSDSSPADRRRREDGGRCGCDVGDSPGTGALFLALALLSRRRR